MRHNRLSYRTMFPLCSQISMTDSLIGWGRTPGFTRRTAQRFYVSAARPSGEPHAVPGDGGRSSDRGNDHGA